MSFNPITNKKKSENICVYLRIRPFNNKEKKKNEKYAIYVSPEGLRINAKEILGDVSSIVEKHKESKFVYDKLFAPETTTDYIFGDYLENVIVSTLKGFNSTVFVYGQTGSGKTHTLMGQYKDYINTCENQSQKKEKDDNYDSPFDNKGKTGKKITIRKNVKKNEIWSFRKRSSNLKKKEKNDDNFQTRNQGKKK